MKTPSVVCGLLVLALGSLACVANNDRALALIKVRGASDLECPQSELMVQSSWGGRYIVSGCGRSTTYDSVCHGVKCQVTREGEEAPPSLGRPDPGSGYGP